MTTRRFAWLRALAGSIAFAATATGTAVAATSGSDAMVREWNQIAVQAVGSTAPFPSTRAMAAVQLAVFEAVNAITHRYQPYLGTVGAPDGASADAAVIAAAHDTLAWIFPAQLGFLDDRRTYWLGTIPDGQPKDDGITVGAVAAAAMKANRQDDGAFPLKFYMPKTTAPYEWQLTPSCYGPPGNGRGGLFLNWQFVNPFGVESASQFRAAPPPEITGGKYAKDFNEVAAVGAADSTVRTEHEADLASFYAAVPPHRAWNSIARQLASVRADEITRTARTLAMLNMSLADGHITVFETKYYYRTWRPETAIHRADEDGNDKTAADPGYRPYIVTPCFPSYPSAHGAGGGAARTILWRAYGRKHHDITLLCDPASDVTLCDPTSPLVLVLHYTDLMDITDDVATARIYGGIHFRVDQDIGDRMGADVARYNDEHWLLPVDLDDD
jgi:hypothetical protein